MTKTITIYSLCLSLYYRGQKWKEQNKLTPKFDFTIILQYKMLHIFKLHLMIFVKLIFDSCH